MEKIHDVVNKYHKIPGGLIPALLEICKEAGELDLEAYRAVAEGFDLPLSQVAGTASFYSCLNPEVAAEEEVNFTETAPHPLETRIMLDMPCDYAGLQAAKAAPDKVIDRLQNAGLCGFGGSGFPVSIKWDIVRKESSDEKFVVCNASEGEPGTYKDLLLLQKAPHAVVEGMAICAETVGASKGYIYLRSDYAHCAEKIQAAIDDARSKGHCGSFYIEIRIGAGAYVCGEETGLIEALEGHRGEPRMKPPFPVVSGLWDKPTVINNAETFAGAAAVLRGNNDCLTKLYTLTGRIKNPGVYELPLGVSMRLLYEEIGGSPDGIPLKAIQIGGGASGAIISAEALDTRLSFSDCAAAGFSLGGGSLCFYGEDTDIAALVKEKIDFFAEQSCGVCAPCRIGLKRLSELLANGETARAEALALHIKQNARCGLGQMASTPFLSALSCFPEEFGMPGKEKIS